MYTIYISRGAEKDLEKLNVRDAKKVAREIDGLAENPRPKGCKKLKGISEPLWRVRVGDYRVIYSIDDTILIVDVRKIGHRRDIYD